MLQNAQMALDFLRYKKIKLVNIRAEDIVDGNPKLTLGLIWTIILHFQVSLANINFSWSPIQRRYLILGFYLYHKLIISHYYVKNFTEFT